MGAPVSERHYFFSDVRTPVDAEQVLEEADEMDVDEGLWEIEEVMGSSLNSQGNVKYLTRWKDFPDEENWTEELFDHFTGTREGALRAFHRKHPNAARDKRLKLRG